MAFDPDKYLAQYSGPSGGFDPDAYLSQKETYVDPIPSIPGIVGNLAAGAIRGAGSIGATLIRPFETAEENEQRRANIDYGLREMGADPDSFAYGTGKFGAEVAGTLGVGGVLAKPLQTIAPRAAQALETWGMLGPRAQGTGKIADAALRVGGGAVTGATAAGVVDPSHIGTSAAIGAAVPFAAPFAGKLADALVQKGQQLARGAQGQAIDYLRKVFPDNWQEVVSRLKDLRGFLPGEQPTAGMAAVSGDTPIVALKALQEGAESRIPQPFAEIQQMNQSARVAPLEEMAHVGRRYPGEAMSEAEALRAQVTDPLYRIAGENRIPLDERVAAILRGEEAAQALRKGETSFQQAQMNAVGGGATPPIGKIRGAKTDTTPVVSEYRSPWELPPIGETSTFMPDLGSRSVNELQRVKNSLTKQIDALSSATDSEGKLKLAQLIEARTQLNEAMRQSGNYALASDIFKNYSAPQNRAQVSEVLLNALRAPTGNERISAFLSAMKNAPQTVKKAGGPRFKDFEQVYTPDQMQKVIRPLERSISREAEYAALQAPQSSLPKLEGALSGLEHITPPIFMPIVTAARTLAKRLGADTDEAAQLVIDRAMTDPRELAKLIEATPPTQRSAVMNGIRKLAASRQTGAVVGATAEAMQ